MGHCGHGLHNKEDPNSLGGPYQTKHEPYMKKLVNKHVLMCLNKIKSLIIGKNNFYNYRLSLLSNSRAYPMKPF